MSILGLSTLSDIIQTEKGEKMSEADCSERSLDVRSYSAHGLTSLLETLAMHQCKSLVQKTRKSKISPVYSVSVGNAWEV